MRLLTRADDFGLNHATNTAILEAAGVGFIRNVSVMATGNALAEAAALLAGWQDICLGMHGVLTSEWDSYRWGSVAGEASLVTPDGHFAPTVAALATLFPTPDAVLREYEAQYQKLCAAGFAVRYLDSHMDAERVTPEVFAALRGWAASHKLVFSADCGGYLPGLPELSCRRDGLRSALAAAADGTYVLYCHPASYSDETKALQNARNPGRTVALHRQLDLLLTCDPATVQLCRERGVQLLRYDELG